MAKPDGNFENQHTVHNTQSSKDKARNAELAEGVRRGNVARSRVAAQKADAKSRARGRLDKI